MSPATLLSKYTKRCVRCQAIKGNSSFAGSPGQRSDVCTLCDDGEKERTKRRAEMARRLARGRRSAQRLARELARVRRRIKFLQEELEVTA